MTQSKGEKTKSHLTDKLMLLSHIWKLQDHWVAISNKEVFLSFNIFCHKALTWVQHRLVEKSSIQTQYLT